MNPYKPKKFSNSYYLKKNNNHLLSQINDLKHNLLITNSDKNLLLAEKHYLLKQNQNLQIENNSLKQYLNINLIDEIDKQKQELIDFKDNVKTQITKLSYFLESYKKSNKSDYHTNNFDYTR